MTRRLLVADRVRTPSGVVGDAVLIEDGHVVEVGHWRNMSAEGVDITSFSGATIVPGFRDAHIHPVGMAANSLGLDLSGVSDFAELGERIRRWAGGLPPHASVIGTGLDDERLLEGRMPNRHDLDEILTARPILVYRHCSHIAAANSAALSRAAIDDTMFDPPGGRIDRSMSGRPTGVLRETAIGLVTHVLEPDLPQPDGDQVAATINRLTRVGITTVDAIVSTGAPIWCGSGNELETLLDAAPRLIPMVVVYVVASTPNELRTAAERITEAPHLRFGGWKGFADGSLGGHTALLREPYSDLADSRGLDRWESAVTPFMAETALELGGSVAIHAIGDAALERVVDLAERLRAAPGTIRAEHASVADPRLIERMADAGVVASVQPQFVESDGPWLERRLGPGRLGHAYPFAGMLETGVTVIAGSDAPIESPDPLAGIRAARHRGGITPEQAIDLDQAVAIHAAHRLMAGDRADLAVIHGDVDAADADVIATTIAGSEADHDHR